jgi:hypothetical protein
MTPDTVKAIQDALAPVAAKIGEGAQYGWEVVIRQQIITAYVDFIWTAASILGCAVCLSLTIYFVRKKREGGYLSDWEIGIGLFAILTFACALWVFIELTDGVQHLFNPDYYALQFFIDLAKPASS